MNFTDTAVRVLLLMAYAVPGFLFVKSKVMTPGQITPFSKVLVYLCQPCLEVHAFLSADCTPRLLGYMGWFFLLCTGIQLFYFNLNRHGKIPFQAYKNYKYMITFPWVSVKKNSIFS